jgi:hypothetical protein
MSSDVRQNLCFQTPSRRAVEAAMIDGAEPFSGFFTARAAAVPGTIIAGLTVYFGIPAL